MQIPQQKLIIKQEVEELEIFTNFETRNKYRILDQNNKDIYYAYEESKFLSRNLLKTIRPLKLVIMNKNKQPELIIERSFFIIRPHYIIKLPNVRIIGHVKKTRWWSIYSLNIFDNQGNLKFTCPPQLPKHPWTYDVITNNSKVALIQKKWSGIGKELYSDADNFLLDFGSIKDNNLKQLLLATVFAIDLTRFERR